MKRYKVAFGLENTDFPVKSEGELVDINLTYVIPPFTVGEAFYETVLGESAQGVELRHLLTDDKATAFLTRVAVSGIASDELDEILMLLGQRIEDLTNHPDRAAYMSIHQPFARDNS